MPTKMAKCCREKTVLLAVYVERPRKRRLLSEKHHHHHHHHYHHNHLHLHQAKQAANGKGYNRRAELLNYSRRLRESAHSAPPSPSPHNPKPTSSYNQQPPITQIIAVGSKPKLARGPACFGNWELMIPSFLRSLTVSQAKQDRKRKKKKSSESTATKAKAIMKSFQVQKKGGFISKVLAALRKHR